MKQIYSVGGQINSDQNIIENRMRRSLSFLVRGGNVIRRTMVGGKHEVFFKPISAINTFKFYSQPLSSSHQHGHKHHHHSDPITEMRKEFQQFSKSLQQKHPNHPEQVIKELYTRCQTLVGENKKVEILMLFEIICEFIEAKNLIETYSSFMVMSASNSFLMGKYHEVERRCKLALPYEIKKHGEKHKNIGDIYNMLGISISKVSSNKGSEALTFLEKALAIRKELYGESGQAAEVLFNAGIIEEESEKMLQRAEQNFLDAVQMLENASTPAPLLYVKSKMRLAETQYKIHQVASKYISDMLRLQELIEKYKKEKVFQKHEQATVDMFSSLLHRNLGKKFLQTNDNPKAVTFLERCLQYLRQNKMQTQDRIEVLESCAIAYTNLGEYTKAANLLQQSEKIVAGFPSVTDEYKFNVWKFIAQVYRKTGELEKELATLQKMRKLLKETKQSFFQPLDYFETEIGLIFCLGNLKKFSKVVEIGEESLKVLEQEKRLPKQQHNDFLSNISAYVGFAHLSNGQADIALQYFTQSDQIFSSSSPSAGRYEFHLNILRRIAKIFIQVKKDFVSGFQYLNKQRLHILSNKQSSLEKKLNDMVVLLLDYEIEAGEGEVEGLIRAGYVERINQVLGEIGKLVKELSLVNGGKQALTNYYVLIDSIHQMCLSFSNIKDQNGNPVGVDITKKLLQDLIRIYDKLFEKEISQVISDTFQGDQALKQMIKRSLKVKSDLLGQK